MMIMRWYGRLTRLALDSFERRKAGHVFLWRCSVAVRETDTTQKLAEWLLMVSYGMISGRVFMSE